MKKAPFNKLSDKKVSNRRFLKALFLATALHTPVILGDREAEIWEERENIAHVVKEEVKSVLNGHPLEKRRYIQQLRKDLADGRPIDLAEFYAKTEYLEGRSDEDRMNETLERFSKIEAVLKKEMTEKDQIAILQRINEEQGGHLSGHTYLSSVVLDHMGNCEGRQKFTSSMIHRLYPDQKIAYQVVKVEGVMHTLSLIEINGQWHSMENPARPLSEEELEGTVLYEKYDYVKEYIGKDDMGIYRGNPKKIRTRTKISVTDDYFRMSLPKGIDFSNIKNFAESGANNVASDRQGLVGSLAPKSPYVAETNSISGGYDLAVHPLEFELLTEADVERNRQRSARILARWRRIELIDLPTLQADFQREFPDFSDGCAKSIVIVIKTFIDGDVLDCRVNSLTGGLECREDEERSKMLDQKFDRLEREQVITDDACKNEKTAHKALKEDEEDEIDKKLFELYGITDF